MPRLTAGAKLSIIASSFPEVHFCAEHEPDASEALARGRAAARAAGEARRGHAVDAQLLGIIIRTGAGGRTAVDVGRTCWSALAVSPGWPRRGSASFAAFRASVRQRRGDQGGHRGRAPAPQATMAGASFSASQDVPISTGRGSGTGRRRSSGASCSTPRTASSGRRPCRPAA